MQFRSFIALLALTALVGAVPTPLAEGDEIAKGDLATLSGDEATKVDTAPDPEWSCSITFHYCS
ncbi:hypothetical protein POSPLADRAFT_1057281 [Postia placenta MAD-698-R-SB12]|uniref:Uncharacterized protein n=1 Tax=Postia placenta MAD-698-R-SB12 TaxID=670580 RepID=A0A1X6MYQ8_9APHY|nr:hypothetical protein POSPLADRAFT_1057281 [Postia placenta MAD-698-R-SB12]OSX61508.1 hypothetical protein POSPLADRAFT_1057281 [Postia placenta MAD-698-R-SB12]